MAVPAADDVELWHTWRRLGDLVGSVVKMETQMIEGRHVEVGMGLVQLRHELGAVVERVHAMWKTARGEG